MAQCRALPPDTFKAKSDYAQRPFSQAGVNAAVRGIEDWPRGAGGFTLILDSYGGVINKVPAGATAFAHRNMLFSMQYYASPGSGSNLAALNRYYHSLRPYVSGFAYVNYIDPGAPELGARVLRRELPAARFDQEEARPVELLPLQAVDPSAPVAARDIRYTSVRG